MGSKAIPGDRGENRDSCLISWVWSYRTNCPKLDILLLCGPWIGSPIAPVSGERHRFPSLPGYGKFLRNPGSGTSLRTIAAGGEADLSPSRETADIVGIPKLPFPYFIRVSRSIWVRQKRKLDWMSPCFFRNWIFIFHYNCYISRIQRARNKK